VYNDEGLRLEFERPKNTSLLKVVIYRVQTVCALSKKKIALYVSKTQTHSQLRDASDSTPTTTTIHSLNKLTLSERERGGIRGVVLSCVLEASSSCLLEFVRSSVAISVVCERTYFLVLRASQSAGKLRDDPAGLGD
jgi:hypothetical protein